MFRSRAARRASTLSGNTPQGKDPSKIAPAADEVAGNEAPKAAADSCSRADAPAPTGASLRPSILRIELKHPSYFLNRELTWLTFNDRVLHEAADKRTPLLERAKFLAIVGSNLDEFHMKRVGGLKQQLGAELSELTVDGRTPGQQIQECLAMVRQMGEQAEAVRLKLLRSLAHRGIRIIPFKALRQADQSWVRQYYVDNVFPLVTPQSIDPAHPFPFVSNLSLNLLVSVRDRGDFDPRVGSRASGGSSVLSRIKLPVGSGIPRMIALRNTHTFVMLEDVMAHCLDLLFPDAVIESCDLFRVTRNASTEKDEESADDLLEMIEEELRERKFAPVVRLEVSEGMERSRRDRLAQELELASPADLFEVSGMLALRDLVELWQLPLPELHDRPHRSVDHPLLASAPNVFQAIRDAGTLMVHHPYQSFATSVERLLREAAADTRVRAIKMTLYRTSAETNAVEHLVEAARNGKQVTVVVELKARFDEEANIRWASRLEAAGIHVTYGVVGLKTHAKVILVVRQDPAGLKRYVHLGTGNYHAGTAKLYTDLGLFTCDDQIGRDASELFNYLTTGVNSQRRFQKLLIGPHMLKQALLARIERETEHARAGSKAVIQMKVNGLEDPDVVRALYRASQAGVGIDLLVRDTCRLRPQVPGLSETIRVVSIVGRFLEHARAFYFHNAGHEEYFIGSADLMTRNLESRVEILVPVEPPDLRLELRRIFDVQLRDQRSAWEMRADGSYQQRVPKGQDLRRSCQEQFIRLTQERYELALETQEKQSKGKVRSNKRAAAQTKTAARLRSTRPPSPAYKLN